MRKSRLIAIRGSLRSGNYFAIRNQIKRYSPASANYQNNRGACGSFFFFPLPFFAAAFSPLPVGEGPEVLQLLLPPSVVQLQQPRQHLPPHRLAECAAHALRRFVEAVAQIQVAPAIGSRHRVVHLHV